MKRTNSEIRKQARQALDNGNWGKGIMVTVICALFSITYMLLFYRDPGAINNESVPEAILINTSSILWVLLCFPLQWGVSIFFLHIVRQKEVKYGNLFDGYKDFFRILFTSLLQTIYTQLWSLLLIIPGIVKAISYSMTSFVLHDHPELKYNGAIEESMRLMKGSKMKLFILYLSFIGWGILCMLTLGIGFFLLVPYIQASKAAFYQDLLCIDASNSEAVDISDIPEQEISAKEI